VLLKKLESELLISSKFLNLSASHAKYANPLYHNLTPPLTLLSSSAHTRNQILKLRRLALVQVKARTKLRMEKMG
jgi:hypothetical protein